MKSYEEIMIHFDELNNKHNLGVTRENRRAFELEWVAYLEANGWTKRMADNESLNRLYKGASNAEQYFVLLENLIKKIVCSETVSNILDSQEFKDAKSWRQHE